MRVDLEWNSDDRRIARIHEWLDTVETASGTVHDSEGSPRNVLHPLVRVPDDCAPRKRNQEIR